MGRSGRSTGQGDLLANALDRVWGEARRAQLSDAEADDICRRGGFLLGWTGAHAKIAGDIAVHIDRDAEDVYLRLAVPCAAETLDVTDLPTLRALSSDGSVNLSLADNLLVGVIQQPINEPSLALEGCEPSGS